MDSRSIEALQREIVHAVAANVTEVMDGEWGDREWVHLFTDFELDHDGVRSSSITFALARRPGLALEKVSFRLPQAAKQLFGELASAMAGPQDPRWSTVQLKVEKDGRFGFEFFHDPPRRLGGALLDERFKDYLDRWLETGTGARRMT